MWEPVAWRLCEAGYRMIALELPGHGASPWESEDVEAEIERLRSWAGEETPDLAAVVGVAASAGVVARLAAETGAIEVCLASREAVVAGDGGLTPARRRAWPGRAEMFEGLRRRVQFVRWRLDVLWRYVEDGTQEVSTSSEGTEAELICRDETEQAWLALGRPLGGMVEVAASPWEQPDAAARWVIGAIEGSR
jgi:pimeloyl-ACP methyl ester carboxylesterase